MPIIIEEGEPYRHHHGRHHSHHHHHSRYRRGCCYFRVPRMHSTQRFRCSAGFTFVFLLAAFVLYLLVTLSLPIIKQIYLFQLSFATQDGQAPTTPDFRFGVWGFCASTVVALPSIFTNDGGTCTSPKIGYNIPQDVLNLTGYPPDVTRALTKALTVLLVLHPVAAGLALLTLFFSLFVRSQYFTVLALISSIVTAVVGSVVLAADLALKIVANDRLKDVLNGSLTVTWGDGVWMIVAAVAMSWLSVITLSIIACRCCGIRRKYGWYGDGYYD